MTTVETKFNPVMANQNRLRTTNAEPKLEPKDEWRRGNNKKVSPDVVDSFYVHVRIIVRTKLNSPA